MHISQKGQCALQLMLDLAIHGKEQNVSIRSISMRQQISEKYLEQIIRPLCRAGYVKSTRGACGGYRLSQPPENYTIGMILTLTEGRLFAAPALHPWENTSTQPPALTALWQALRDAVEHIVNRVTLADLKACELGQRPLLPADLKPFEKEFLS